MKKLANTLIRLVASMSHSADGWKISNEEKTNEKKKKKQLKGISRVLNLSVRKLKNAKHPTDITKTCRSIIKLLYPDESVRAQMSVSKMSPAALVSIHGKSYFKYT